MSDYVASNGKKIGEECIGKDLEGSNHDLIVVLAWLLPEGTKGNHENLSHGGLCPFQIQV
jgi:hypothetical protein